MLRLHRLKLLHPSLRPYASTVASLLESDETTSHQPGQFFINKNTPYRGLIIGKCKNLSAKSRLDGNYDAFPSSSSSTSAMEISSNHKDSYYHVLIDKNDWLEMQDIPTDIRIPKNLRSDNGLQTSNNPPGPPTPPSMPPSSDHNQMSNLNRPNRSPFSKHNRYDNRKGPPSSAKSQDRDRTNIPNHQNLTDFSSFSETDHILDPLNIDGERIYYEGHDIVHHNEILPISLKMLRKENQASIFNKNQNDQENHQNNHQMVPTDSRQYGVYIDRIFDHMDASKYFKRLDDIEPKLPRNDQAYFDNDFDCLSPRMNFPSRKIQVYNINEEEHGLKIRIILTYIGNRHFKFIPAMHWWQMKIKIENTSNSTFRLVSNSWVHSRYDASVNNNTPHIEEDTHFLKFKPLLEPFVSPVFNYTTPHCVDDQAYIENLKQQNKKGVPNPNSKYINDLSSFEAANKNNMAENFGKKNMKNKKKRRKVVRRNSKNYKELDETKSTSTSTVVESSPSSEKNTTTDTQDLDIENLLENSKIFDRDRELEKILNDSDKLLSNEDTAELVEMLLEESEGEADRKSDPKSVKVPKTETIEMTSNGYDIEGYQYNRLKKNSTPTVYGLFQFKKIRSSGLISIKTPVMYLDHSKF